MWKFDYRMRMSALNTDSKLFLEHEVTVGFSLSYEQTKKGTGQARIITQEQEKIALYKI